MKNYLIFPMAFYVFYIFALARVSMLRRIKAIKEKKMQMQFFKTYQGNDCPDDVVIAGRHFDNQFQVPILFLVTCAMHFSLGNANQVTIALAWLFVISRATHSFIHLGANKIQHRVAAYVVGWIAVLALWLQMIYFVI